MTSRTIPDVKIRSVTYHRWLIFAVLAATNILVFFYRSATGVMRAELTADFALSVTAFSVLSTMYFYPYAIMQLPTGILVDTWGERKTIAVGCLVTTLGGVIFAAAPNFEIACLGRAIIGVGVSGPVICLQKNAAHWFRPGEQGFISGVGGMAGSLGHMMAQAPLAMMLVFFSWRSTFLALAGVSLLLAFIGYRIIRNSPEDMGFAPMGGQGAAHAGEKLGVFASLKSVFGNRLSWAPFMVNLVSLGAYNAFGGTWAIPYIKDVYGYDTVGASAVAMWIVVGMAVGSVGIGLLSDKLGRRKPVLIAFTLLGAACWSALTFASEPLRQLGGLSPVLFLLGLSMSSMYLIFTIVREVNHQRCAGIAVGASNMLCLLISAFFTTAIGRIIDAQAGARTSAALYQNAFVFLVILYCVGILCAMLVKETHCENIYTRK